MSPSSLYQDALSHLMSLATPPPPSELRASASIVPWRVGGDRRTEVFWVRRNLTMGVLGGWRAFPGGGVSPADKDLPLHGKPTVGTDASFPRYDLLHFEPDLSPATFAAALRELWEETGLLLTTPIQDNTPPIERTASEAALATWLAENHLALDASRLVFAGRWITPPISAFRFDTRFFLW
ncbi:NUDIX hydrolase [bacterium]|nr:NUDIX hydrolase [bacterium]